MKCIMHLRSLNNGRKRVNIEKYGMRSFYNIGCDQDFFHYVREVPELKSKLATANMSPLGLFLSFLQQEKSQFNT